MWTIEVSGAEVKLFCDGLHVGTYPLRLSRKGRIGMFHNGGWLFFQRNQ